MSACGDVTFVDPGAATRDALTILGAEALTVEGDSRSYLQVILTGPIELWTEVQLTVRYGEERRALPLSSTSIETCGPAVVCLRGAWGPGALEGATALSLHLPQLSQDIEAPLSARSLGPYALAAEVVSGNERVALELSDPLEDTTSAGESIRPWRRPFEVVSVPGRCAGAPVEGWAKVETWPAVVELRLAGDLFGCVSVRPADGPRGPPVAVETVEARAVVRRFQHVYRPPSAPSPLVWAAVLDLEVPGEARCHQAVEALTAGLREEALAIARQDLRGAPVVALTPLQLALTDGVACRQSDTRSFDPARTADDWAAELRAAVSGVSEIRVLLVYATNLALELPGALRSNLNQLGVELQGRGIQSEWVALGPEVAIGELDVRDAVPWVSTLDPAFRDTLAALLGRRWPFESLLHTPETVVPLAAESDVEGLSAWRLCASTPIVEPLGGALGNGAFSGGSRAPAYRVDLGFPFLLASTEFRAPVVEVAWEGCYALCDRASPGRSPELSWLSRDSCSSP